jgi:hypothetical protein
MKKYFFLTIIAFLIIGMGNVEAQYGNTKKKKKKKKSSTEKTKTERPQAEKRERETAQFSDNMWYGLNIGNIQFGSGFFSMGISPTAGYRIVDQLSAGVMVKLDYFYERGFGFGGERFSYSTLDFGPTVFTRYKIGEQFFVQAEYERAIFQRALGSGGAPVIIEGKVQKTTFGEDYLYMGVGYGGGYPFGTYISLHYNVLDNIEATRIPWDYRIGLVWNF